MNIAEKAWEKVRDAEAGDASWKDASPAHRARLESVVGELRTKGTSTGIAGLEKFEEEAGKLLKVDVSPSGEGGPFKEGVTAFSGDVGAEAGAGRRGAGKAEGDAELTPKGSGAQEGDTDPLASAAAANQKVESDEVNSPGRGSAARALGAEAPGGGFNPGAEKTEGSDAKAGEKTEAKTSTQAASKSPAAGKDANEEVEKARARNLAGAVASKAASTKTTSKGGTKK